MLDKVYFQLTPSRKFNESILLYLINQGYKWPYDLDSICRPNHHVAIGYRSPKKISWNMSDCYSLELKKIPLERLFQNYLSFNELIVGKHYQILNSSEKLLYMGPFKLMGRHHEQCAIKVEKQNNRAHTWATHILQNYKFIPLED